MKKTIEQWKAINPQAMAHEMSDNAKQFAFEDAKSDILHLAHENALMREILRKIAYPRRGTEESAATIYTFAEMIQAKWTLYDLEHL